MNTKWIIREHKFPYESFIAGWYIDPQICDDLIDLFNDNKEHQKVGVSGGPFNVQKNVIFLLYYYHTYLYNINLPNFCNLLFHKS